MLSSIQAHLSITRINFIRFHVSGTMEFIMCLDFLKTYLKLKIQNRKFEIRI